MDLTAVLIQLISGAVGGNVAGIANNGKESGAVVGALVPLIVGMLNKKA
jgi:hypothetical protein